MGRYEIRLYKHSSAWSSDASSAISALRRYLGASLADAQHIGSTAIRGIQAVPVIDIGIALHETASVAEVLRQLSAHGYRRIPPDETGCIRMSYTRRNRPGDAYRLWITRIESKAWLDLIAFRNYLNNHVFAANEYEGLKKELACRYRHNPTAYAAAKNEFIESIIRLSFTDQFLGRRLTIVIDRPYGSQHPNHPELHYSLNYGFVPGIPAPDGENLDAYILGVQKPMRRFTGTVIAAIHRRNDVEDKLVVAPSGMIAYEPQIAEAVRFQEQHFDTRVICIYEKSCGAILYRIRPDQKIEYLILYQHRSGTWSIPKGHIDANESEEETALREVWEETGLSVSLVKGFRRELSYTVSAKTSKNLVIFLAEAQGELSLGANEISDSLWAEKATAISRLGGRSIGRILEAAEVFIQTRLMRHDSH